MSGMLKMTMKAEPVLFESLFYETWAEMKNESVLYCTLIRKQKSLQKIKCMICWVEMNCEYYWNCWGKSNILYANENSASLDSDDSCEML